MNENLAMLLVVGSAFLAACSQLLLKKSADKKHESLWREYFNIRVISSYAILFLTAFINMYALIYLPYKVVPMVGTASYIFVILLSKIVLKEQIHLKKGLGIVMIVVGIVIFNFN